MSDSTLFVFGVIVSLLFLAGAIYNVIEFRKMGEHPEDYTRARRKR